MGSYSIWAWASVVFGLVCSGIYTLIAGYRKFSGNPWRRLIVWAILYTLAGLAITRFIYHFLSD